MALSCLCLVAGTCVYLLFRPTTLLLFEWVESLGMLEPVMAARQLFRRPESPWIEWAVFSLPYALWVLADMLLVGAIWGRDPSPCKIAWLALVPAIAIGAEVGQAWGWIPGRFDPVDLALIVSAAVLGSKANMEKSK